MKQNTLRKTLTNQPCD